MIVAAHPTDPQRLVGGAITFTKPDGGVACRVFASRDGGYSWRRSEIEWQVQRGGADPQVAFTPRGTALFSALSSVFDAQRRSRASLNVHRSDDGGFTWLPPLDLGYSYDHPQMVVDHGSSRFAGRIYIAVLYGREYNLGVFVSDDDGRTFTGPHKFTEGHGVGKNTSPPVVLSDGTLVVSFIDFSVDPAQQTATRSSAQWISRSSDGGHTFSAPSRIGMRQVPPRASEAGLRQTTVQLAVDPSRRFPIGSTPCGPTTTQRPNAL